MNLYKKEIYKKSLQHAERRNHKYLYIDANGRYIYPEDVPKGTTGIQRHHAQVLSDRRQAKKDKEFKNRERAEKFFGLTESVRAKKTAQQIAKSHQGSTEYITGSFYKYRDPEEVELDRKIQKINQKNAARQAEEERKKMGDVEEGSTEELERQKRKTKARKSASKRFNELDQKNKRFSNSMEPNIQKQHSQINSAHQMATERRMTGNSFSDKKWNRQNLYSVNYYDQSGSVERQKRKTKARKSASKRFNELDQKNKRSSNSMEPDIQKQHSQINSAHQMATERRMTGNSFSDKKWNRQNLYSVNYYDQSGSVERQKRKTALRKRHKK